MQKINCVGSVGTISEINLTRRKVLDFSKKVAFFGVDTYQRKPSEVRNEFLRALPKGNGKNVMVFSDIGDSADRHYKAEMLLSDLKKADPAAAFVLLTTNQNCLGEYSAMLDFVNSRGFDGRKVIRKTDYIIDFSSQESTISVAMMLHETRLNIDKIKKAILVVEDMPSYYTGFILSIYRHIFAANASRKPHVLLARDFESAKKTLSGLGNAEIEFAIIDLRFPKNGKIVENAGLEVMNLVRSRDQKTPIILQSADSGLISQAMDLQGKRLKVLQKQPQMMFPQMRDMIGDVLRK